MSISMAFNSGEPIIRSLLYTDFYKLTMMYFVWLLYPDIWVKYGSKNRTTSVHLAKTVDEQQLREQLDHVRTLRFAEKEIEFIGNYRGPVSGRRVFPKEFLSFLRTFQLPEYQIQKGSEQYEITFEGVWPKSILWETFGMTIMNTLHFRSIGKDVSEVIVAMEGGRIIHGKLDLLSQYPEIRWMDFATRRARHPDWHEAILNIMINRCPEQLVGTSNVFFAKKYGLTPMGTMAHELFMVVAALLSSTDVELRTAQQVVLGQWEDVFGPDLLIALTDTFGSEAFFRDMTIEQAQSYTGLRQDSGIPTQFIDRAEEFYKECGVATQEKLIVPSDGLTPETMIQIYNHTARRFPIVNGWGTNAGNDTGNMFSPISIVVKAIEANGISTVKLSDNLAKATGSPKDIERYKRTFGYTGDFSAPTVY